MADNNDIDHVTGVNTTGHEWDGIKELNNPLPKWWLTVFYACIIWSFGYCLVYPAVPLISSYTKGYFGYSSRGDVAQAMSDAKAAHAEDLTKLANASLEEIRTSPNMLEFALAGGRSAFSVNCSQCHGSGAAGGAGYPNLNDDEWLWGGTLDEIKQTIVHGARNNVSDDAHVSDMPAFLKDEILSKGEIKNVVAYVRELSGQKATKGNAMAGAEIFAEQCVACHSEDGSGNTELGAPALNNNIWLYGGDEATITQTVSFSRSGVMPAWGPILDDVTIKQLAVYVHSLGGGK